MSEPSFYISITVAANGSMRVYFKAPEPDTFGRMLDDFKRSVEERRRAYDLPHKWWRVHPSQYASLVNWSNSWKARGADVVTQREATV